jgi:A/G-specific adenine glycosylase
MRDALRTRKIVKAVRRWYLRHGRKLPWRGSPDPYRVILSEVMLQQTQVARVLEKFPLFLRKFPTLSALAKAPLRDVTIAWRGMGYNNRAVRLHALARALTDEYRGQLPASAEELLLLPGIGRYTAHALLCAVHGKPVPLVDVNIRRLYSRLFFRMRTFDRMREEGEIWDIAGSLLPSRRTYDWNQALMDIGATVCTAQRPACAQCPVARFCLSRHSMRRAGRRAKRAEPGLRGIPNRIYRGRIIEELRRAGAGRGIGESRLGKRIHPGFATAHAAWLRSLLRGLESDGLITVAPGRGGRQARVTLA